jgi:hypothetical protein
LKFTRDGSGQSKIFFKKGVNYKRVAKFKHEQDADAFVEDWYKKVGSKRVEPVIERMRYSLSTSKQLGRLSNLGFTRYRVYVPIMEK